MPTEPASKVLYLGDASGTIAPNAAHKLVECVMYDGYLVACTDGNCH